MKVFRWSGLIAFVIFTALLAVLGLFFLDSWTKKAVEAAGFSVNGAEVNVANVDLTLNPLGFRFEGVQVADARKPTHNVVEIGQMRLAINFPQLFLGNVRLQDVTVADVRTRTEREREARIAVKADSESEASGNALSDAAGEQVNRIAGELPAPATVVENQTRNTRQAVASAEQTMTGAKARITEAAQRVPGDDELADYRTRIAAIRAQELKSIDDIRRMQALVAEVGTDVAQDKLAIESVKVQMNGAMADSRQALDDVTAAPGQDWAQLKADYPLNRDSAMKVARLLIGDGVFEKFDQVTYWYGKAKPWIRRLAPQNADEVPRPERLRGEFVRFPHPDPTARFQLDRALVSFTADNWPWSLTVEDLTSHRGERFVPTQVKLQRGSDDNAGLIIDGILDRVDGQSVDRLNLTGNGVSFAPRSLDLADANLTWTPEPADMTGQLTVTDGQMVGEIALAFPGNEFAVSGQGVTADYVRQALAQISEFDITIQVRGTVQSPQLTIASTLDNRLGDALRNVAKDRYDAWLAEVRTELDAQVAQLRAPADDALSDLTRQRDEVNKRIAQFETEVVAELKSLETRLSNERKRLEDAAGKAAEDKLKEETDKLTDQFSF